MLRSKRYLYVGFMAHQSIEKILKAFFVKTKGESAPFSHSLSYLAKKSELYGSLSYARGTSTEESDVDVAIIVNDLKGDYFSTRPLLWKIRREVDDRIEPVLIDKAHDESGFFETIKKTGIRI